MKYQCPYCESFDVYRADNGDVICFECFAICSDSKTNTSQLDTKNLPPIFPQEYERRKLRKKEHSSKDAIASEKFMRNIV
ncbi:MAG: hypothetical protein WCQ47_01975 [bacterium]